MKYYGKIGFAKSVETAQDVYEDQIIEREYYGDIYENYGREMSTGSEVARQITVNNQISILADPYSLNHYFHIKYLEWEGVKWIVSNVAVAYPRLILTLGGLYEQEN